MRKSEKYTGQGRASLVSYQGKLRRLVDLADERNIGRSTLWGRWVNAGRPRTITEHMLRPSTGLSNTPHAYFYTVDGRRYTAKQMVAEFGVVQSTLDNHRISKGKTAYTTEELREWRRNIEEKKAAVRASSKWARGPSEPPPFGHDLTLIEKAALRFLAW